MKRFAGWCALCLALSVTLIFAAGARAQTARTSGTVLDYQGKPWPGVTVTISDPDTGQKYVTTTDKDGKYSRIGLRPGVYDLNFRVEGKADYTQKINITIESDNILDINFKEIASRPGAINASEKAKAEEQENLFKSMKAHFANGLASMTQVSALRAQLRTAPPDQRSSLQDQIKSQCTTAVSEFELAEKGVAEKEVKNHSVVLSNLGVAYECLGRYDDAVGVLQKGIDLNPDAGSFTEFATTLVKAGITKIDPKNADAQLADLYAKAADDCTKAGTLDPTGAAAAPCWRNVGIVFHNRRPR